MIKISNPILPDKEIIKGVVDDIWKTNQLSNFGKYAQLFEQKVKDYVGCEYVLAVSNCDTALRLCIEAMKMSGNPIAMPTFTFNSTFMAADWNGSQVELMDINPESMLVELNTIEDCAKRGIKNFILVNTFGNLYDIRGLNFLVEKHGLNILFDSAHSFGSTYEGKRSGNLGYTECFSFSPTKLITSGEGGIICTNDKALYDQLKYSRNYGFYLNYDSICKGSNAKLSEINAAIGAYSIDILPDVLERKQKIVESMKDQISKRSNYRFQCITSGVASTYKDFIVLGVPQEIQKRMKEKEIEVKKYFFPLHKQSYIKNKGNYPNADFVYENSICIPSHVVLTKEEIETVIRELCL